MYIKRQNFLNIQYKWGQGLLLNWNFKDVLSCEKYFKHLIVILTPQLQFASSFLANFYTKMKMGDLLSCIFICKDGSIHETAWHQKTSLHKFNSSRVLKGFSTSNLNTKKRQLLIEEAARKTLQYDEFMITNILMNTNDSSKFYRQIILRQRTFGNGFNYIVNLFGDTQQSKISVHGGINFFRLDPEAINDYVMFYHNFVNSAVIPFAKVKISCLNAEMGLQSEEYWRSLEFNTIETVYFGPSSQFSSDLLCFYIPQLSQQRQILLQIKLQLTLFSSKKYLSLKRLHLSPICRRDCQLKSYSHRNEFEYLLENGFELSENPYKCTSRIMLFKVNNQMQTNQSFELL